MQLHIIPGTMSNKISPFNLPAVPVLGTTVLTETFSGLKSTQHVPDSSCLRVRARACVDLHITLKQKGMREEDYMTLPPLFQGGCCLELKML